MIVISQNLVLSPSDDEPLTHPVIGWHNLATDDNLTTTTAAEGYPATNLHNVSTNLLWRASTAPADEYITVTFDETETDPIDYIGVAGHNFGTAQATLSIEGYEAGEDDPTFFPLGDGVMVADDKPIIFRFEPTSLTAIRLRVRTGTVVPEAAVFFVGKLLVFEQGVQGDYTPLPFARVTHVINGGSEDGHFLGRIATGAHVESQANFANLTPGWVREHLDPFLEASAVQPFFFAWSPEAYPDEVGFAWLENNAQPAFNIDGYTSVEFRMTGIVQ